MDNSIRLQYLEAMGIDVWVSRKQKPVEESQLIDKTDFSIEEQVANSQLDSIEDSWDLLQKQVAECKKCILSETRGQTVFGKGNVNADWMLIGEAPNKQGEMEGNPFSGQSRYLLTEMIRAMGLQREDVYITNIVKCRPPEDKDPNTNELTSCHGYLLRQIALVNPKIILAVGRIAAHSLLATKQPLAELRGVAHQVNDIPVVVVYHPAYLLRSLLEKRKAWQDLQFAIKIYQEEK